MGLHTGGQERMLTPTGTFFITLTDEATGEVLQHIEKKNIITLDAGILAAILFKDNMSRAQSVYMLSIGTGATGNLLSPDAPDNRQRKLNAELARKPFTSTTFRNAAGAAVAIPTNIVDFTTTFTAADPNGALNEMGLISPISPNPAPANWQPNPNAYPTYNPAVDLTLYDILVNYLTFPVISKTAGTVLTITWRLTF